MWVGGALCKVCVLLLPTSRANHTTRKIKDAKFSKWRSLGDSHIYMAVCSLRHREGKRNERPLRILSPWCLRVTDMIKFLRRNSTNTFCRQSQYAFSFEELVLGSQRQVLYLTIRITLLSPFRGTAGSSEGTATAICCMLGSTRFSSTYYLLTYLFTYL